MNVNVLRSYLVGLGFQVDHPGLTKFQQTIEQVGKQVEQHTEGVQKSFVAMGATIASAYAAVGAATVALMDRVSQAELGYQLFSMRMYMSADAGKKLKIAMDALGHSLEEIAWNPELQERFHQLIVDQQKLQEGLGPDYQKRMRELRDFRFEITRAQVAVQYLGMALVNDLAKAFGIDSGKVGGWVNWLIEHVPELADRISRHLVPILRDTWSIMRDLWDIGKTAFGVFTELAVAFAKIFGFDSDHKIDQQKTELERFLTVLEEISHTLANVVHWIDRMKEALGLTVGTSLGARAGFTIGSFFGPMGSVIGTLLGGTGGYLGTKYLQGRGEANTGAPTSENNAADHARELAKRVSSQTGVPADWIFAQWAHETNYFRSNVFRTKNNLGGMREGMQYRNFSSMDESADYFARLLTSSRYRNAREANTVEGYEMGLKRGGYYEDTYANYSRGMARFLSPQSRGDVHVGGVQVYVTNPGASADDVHRAVVAALDDKLGESTQRQLAEVGGKYR